MPVSVRKSAANASWRPSSSPTHNNFGLAGTQRRTRSSSQGRFTFRMTQMRYDAFMHLAEKLLLQLAVHSRLSLKAACSQIAVARAVADYVVSEARLNFHAPVGSAAAACLLH